MVLKIGKKYQAPDTIVMIEASGLIPIPGILVKRKMIIIDSRTDPDTGAMIKIEFMTRIKSMTKIELMIKIVLMTDIVFMTKIGVAIRIVVV